LAEQRAIRARGELRERLARCNHVLFLCYGNINRSALAEQHLRQLAVPRLTISSCGFHVPDGRPLDPTMRALAKEASVDFPAWSSRTVSRELVASADLILAMEAGHLTRLRAEYPEVEGRAFLLSCVTSPGTIPLEIRDPFGGPPDVYQQCIAQVTSATAAIAEIKARTRRPERAPIRSSLISMP
jgi:protein-tyrosine-phosphatase